MAGSYVHSVLPYSLLTKAISRLFTDEDHTSRRSSERKETHVPEISGLKRHLHIGIGAKPMLCDELLPVSLKFQPLAIVLTNQVTDPPLRISYRRPQLGDQMPFEFLWGRVDVLLGFDTILLR